LFAAILHVTSTCIAYTFTPFLLMDTVSCVAIVIKNYAIWLHVHVCIHHYKQGGASATRRRTGRSAPRRVGGFDTCFEPDVHKHTKGDCWLKFTEGPGNPEVSYTKQATPFL
jgi:hypothetical protein